MLGPAHACLPMAMRPLCFTTGTNQLVAVLTVPAALTVAKPTVMLVKNAHCDAVNMSDRRFVLFAGTRKRVWYFHLATRQLWMSGCGSRTRMVPNCARVLNARHPFWDSRDDSFVTARFRRRVVSQNVPPALRGLYEPGQRGGGGVPRGRLRYKNRPRIRDPTGIGFFQAGPFCTRGKTYGVCGFYRHHGTVVQKRVNGRAAVNVSPEPIAPRNQFFPKHVSQPGAVKTCAKLPSCW